MVRDKISRRRAKTMQYHSLSEDTQKNYTNTAFTHTYTYRKQCINECE